MKMILLGQISYLKGYSWQQSRSFLTKDLNTFILRSSLKEMKSAYEITMVSAMHPSF